MLEETRGEEGRNCPMVTQQVSVTGQLCIGSLKEV